MYIYHALINALSAHVIHINLNMIFCTLAEHSPTKTIYIKYFTKTKTKQKMHYTHTHTHTHTHSVTVAETGYKIFHNRLSKLTYWSWFLHKTVHNIITCPNLCAGADFFTKSSIILLLVQTFIYWSWFLHKTVHNITACPNLCIGADLFTKLSITACPKLCTRADFFTKLSIILCIGADLFTKLSIILLPVQTSVLELISS